MYALSKGICLSLYGNGGIVMAWVCVDLEGNEFISSIKPEKNYGSIAISVNKFPFRELIHIQKGSIKKLIGIELSWNDEPVELK